MPCWRHSLWLHCAVEAGILLRQLVICNQPCQYCYLLVTNALQNFGGQPIIQVGLLWIPHSIEAGLFLSNVCSVAVLLFAKWCILKQFCFVRLFLAPLWALDGVIPCSVHLRLLHCKMRNMFCCGKLCTLVLSLWDFNCYSCKGDDDIKIQRRHIKLGNNELKRQFATTERWAAGTEATELFSAEFHPNVAQTQNGVAKTHGSGDWFDGWLCARKRRCRFDFCQWQEGK